MIVCLGTAFTFKLQFFSKSMTRSSVHKSIEWLCRNDCYFLKGMLRFVLNQYFSVEIFLMYKCQAHFCFHLSIYLYICIYLSIYLSTYISIYLSIYLISNYPFQWTRSEVNSSRSEMSKLFRKLSGTRVFSKVYQTVSHRFLK